MTYSKKSLIDVQNISLSPENTYSAKFEFEPGEVDVSSLMYQYKISGDLKTRYSGKFQVAFIIQYYNEEIGTDGKMKYSDGNVHTITSIPYMLSELQETKGVGEEELVIENKSIKSIVVKLKNSSSSSITVQYVNLLKSLYDVDEDILIIPLIESLEELDDKPEDSLWRCEWIEGTDY